MIYLKTTGNVSIILETEYILAFHVVILPKENIPMKLSLNLNESLMDLVHASSDFVQTGFKMSSIDIHVFDLSNNYFDQVDF